MDEYGVKLPIIFQVDKDSLNKAKEALEEAQPSETETKSGGGFLKKLHEVFDKNKNNFVDAAKATFGVSNASIWMAAMGKLKEILFDALDEFNNIVDSSYLTNATTRQNLFTYGLNASQSYGFEKAKSMLGVDEESMIYMNDFQRSKFIDIMQKYTEKYNELYDKGFFDKYLEAQIAIEEFQLDFKLELVQFFANNKDTIMLVLDGLIEFMEFVTNALSVIAKPGEWLSEGLSALFGDSSTQNVERYQNNNSTNYKTNNVNMNYYNTFNGETASQRDSYLNMLNASAQEAILAMGGVQ